MLCPSCGMTVEAGAWFCPVCAHQLHDDVQPPALGPASGLDTQRDATFVDEVSRTVAWADTPQITAEALIVGEVSEVSGPARTYHGAVAREDGSTPAFQLYTSSDAVHLDDPTIAPRRTSQAPGDDLTPYEQFVYEEVDGQRTLGEIQSAGLLAPTEIQVSLLTLIERGLVSLAPPSPAAPMPTLDPSFLVEIPETPRPAARSGAAPQPLTPSPPPAPLPPRGRIVSLDTPQPPPAPPPVPASVSVLAPASAPAPRPSIPAPHATVVRTRPSDPAPGPGARESARDGALTSLPPKRAHDAPPLGPRDVRLDKARELFGAAMVDRAAGNVVSARMNLKLAIAFDPDNTKYQDTFAQLGQVRPGGPRDAGGGPGVGGPHGAAEPPPEGGTIARPAAQKAYDDACAAEAAGDVDRAVKLLEAALRLGDDPVIMNRLGVVLAMKKGEWKRGQELLFRAVELSPMNPVYTHNLSKILGLAASRDVDRAAAPKAKGGFWKRLLGR